MFQLSRSMPKPKMLHAKIREKYSRGRPHKAPAAEDIGIACQNRISAFNGGVRRRVDVDIQLSVREIVATVVKSRILHKRWLQVRAKNGAVFLSPAMSQVIQRPETMVITSCRSTIFRMKG